MLNLILQRIAPIIIALAMLLNSTASVFGLDPVIPYNTDRTDVVVSGKITTDIKEILEWYNSAVKKSGLVVGKSYADVVGTPKVTSPDISNIDMNAYWQAYEEIVTYVFEVPGNGELTVADVKSAKMSEENGKKSLIIKLKDTNKFTEDSPVSKGFGYKAGAEDGFEMVGFTISGGEYDEKYTDCVISCVIGSNGKIIYGDWDSTGHINAKNITVEMFGYEATMSMEYEMIHHIDI